MAKKPLLIAITGGTGFVGRNVVDAALRSGNAVRAMVRRPEAVADLSHKNLTWVKGALGAADVELVKGCDVVVHLAGLIKARTKHEFYDVNAIAAGKIAEAAQAAGGKRFVLISSMAAGKPELSDYAGSKKAGELAVQKSFKGEITIIRAPAVFGPGDSATAPFFKLLAKGLLPVPGGRGWKTRLISMSYAPDLGKSIVDAAITGAYSGETVSPATIGKMNWLEFGALCEQAFGRNIKVFPLPLGLLYPVAGVTSVTSRLLGMGHLTLGKLAEFLHPDWSSETLISQATPSIEALKITMAAYGYLKELDNAE